MKLSFKNKKFTVLQVSDAQDLQFTRKTMLRMLDAAYDRVKPDLVVLTGDNILGNHLRDARFGSRKVVKTREGEKARMETAIGNLVRPIEKRKIPFAMIYGNHDDRNEISKQEQANIYRLYSMCVGLDNPDESVDPDTYNIPVYSSDGDNIRFNLWMLDSARYDKKENKCYEEVTKETVEWFERTNKELTAKNDSEPVPSILFLHIPLQETMRLLTECSQGESALRPDAFGRYFRPADSVCGSMKEIPSVLSEQNGLFEAVKRAGAVRAVVSGHDHMNCFTGSVEGVDIVASSCASFRCYGDRTRGVRVFTIDEDSGTYTTEFLTYSVLCGTSLPAEIRYIWDADGMGKAKAALVAGAACCAGIVSVGIGFTVKTLKHRK